MEKYEILSFSYFLTLEDETNQLSHNIGKELPFYICNIPEERKSHLYCSGSLKSCMYEGPSVAVKQPGHDADYSPPSSTQVKNEWSYSSTPHVNLQIYVHLALAVHPLVLHLFPIRPLDNLHFLICVLSFLV